MPRCLRRGSAAARLPGQWVRNPPGHRISSLASVVCCVVEVSASGWSLVQRSVSECDHKSLIIRRPWPTWGCCAIVKKMKNFRMANLHVRKFLPLLIFYAPSNLLLALNSEHKGISLWEWKILSTEQKVIKKAVPSPNYFQLISIFISTFALGNAALVCKICCVIWWSFKWGLTVAPNIYCCTDYLRRFVRSFCLVATIMAFGRQKTMLLAETKMVDPFTEKMSNCKPRSPLRNKVT